jgi:hypothetical protein
VTLAKISAISGAVVVVNVEHLVAGLALALEASAIMVHAPILQV